MVEADTERFRTEMFFVQLTRNRNESCYQHSKIAGPEDISVEFLEQGIRYSVISIRYSVIVFYVNVTVLRSEFRVNRLAVYFKNQDPKS